MFCVDRAHKHNVVDIWKSGDGESGDSQPLLDEPDLSAASTDLCQRPGLFHNDTARRWRWQWTGQHDLRRVVDRRPRSLSSDSYSIIVGNHPAAPADSVPTPAARRHWRSSRGRDNSRQVCRRTVAAIAADCRCRNDDALTSSVYCQCSGPFRWCTLVIVLLRVPDNVVSCSCHQWRANT